MSPMTNPVEILSDRAVSPNGNAGITCAYPQTTLLNSGQIVCVYRQGESKHSHDGKLVRQCSDNGGQSWSKPTTVFDGTGMEPSQTVISGGVCAIDTNKLLVTFGAVLGLERDVYLFGDEGKRLPRRLNMTFSRDAGQTWTAPAQVDTRPFAHAGVTTRPLLLPDGAVGIPIEVQTDVGVQATAMIQANDGGGELILGPLTLCVADPTGELNLCDAHFTVLENGDILMLLWTFRQEDEQTINVRRCCSSDAGRAWSLPEPTTIEGQVTVPLALSPGTVIAASNNRQAMPGIYLYLSADNGKTWNASRNLVWDEAGKRVTGEFLPAGSSGVSDLGVWDQLPGFMFGTPDLVKLPDGSVLMTYYACIDDVFHVRACRMRIDVR